MTPVGLFGEFRIRAFVGGVIGVLVYDTLISPIIRARAVAAEAREEGPATEEI